MVNPPSGSRFNLEPEKPAGSRFNLYGKQYLMEIPG